MAGQPLWEESTRSGAPPQPLVAWAPPWAGRDLTGLTKGSAACHGRGPDHGLARPAALSKFGSGPPAGPPIAREAPRRCTHALAEMRGWQGARQAGARETKVAPVRERGWAVGQG